MIQAKYVGEGVRGLMSEGGTGRRNAIDRLVKSLGGRLDSVYYAFGDTDIFVIAEMPDAVSAAATSLITNASGLVEVKTTVLLTVEQMDEAAKKTPSYRAPGMALAGG